MVEIQNGGYLCPIWNGLAVSFWNIVQYLYHLTFEQLSNSSKSESVRYSSPNCTYVCLKTRQEIDLARLTNLRLTAV